jgi:hypothetical protein
MMYPTPPHWRELGECEGELNRQDRKWGPQNHPDLAQYEDVGNYAALADSWKHLNDTRAQSGMLSWSGILFEEVYEALGETDPDKMATELVQVAAVALQWAEAIRRRETQG